MPQLEVSNNVVCATSKVSDQPAHMCSLIRTFSSRLNIIFNECQATGGTSLGVSNLKRRPHRLTQVYTCQNATWLEITCRGSFMPRREKTCLRDPDSVRR